MLTCFWLTKGCDMQFRPKTTVTSLLHLIVLFYNVIISQEKILIMQTQKTYRGIVYFQLVKHPKEILMLTLGQKWMKFKRHFWRKLTDYITDLWQLAEVCNFQRTLNECLRDQFVCGIYKWIDSKKPLIIIKIKVRRCNFESLSSWNCC